MTSFRLSRRAIIAGTAALPLAGTTLAAEPADHIAPKSTIRGSVMPGFEGVRAAFEDNFASGKEIGASFAVYRDGVPLVDLWGGSANEAGTVPVTDRTLYSLMSTTKGLTSICVAMLVDRGKLDYEAPVAKYWPEFAANGKSAMTVGHLMSHQVGLTGPREPVTVEDLWAHDSVAAMLASQEPFFLPGTWGYHSMTFGTLADELVRRTDGRTVGGFFAEEVASKFEIDAFMGLPAEEEHRAATMVSAMDSSTLLFDSPNPAAQAAARNPARIYWGPDQRLNREHGFPASDGTSSARALAKLYGLLVQADQPGVPVLLSKPVLRQATRERIAGVDQCGGALSRYAAGFRLNDSRYGSNPAAFGHAGYGGSVGFADPARRFGIAYTPNRMLNPHWYGMDPRLGSLLAALYAAERAK